MASLDRSSASMIESQLPVSSEVEAEFDAGLAAGLDPDASYGRALSKSLPDGRQRVTTTLRSCWLHRPCPTCKHTFRPGDDVLVLADGQVMHDMPNRHCDNADLDPAAGAASRSAFFAGIEQAWPIADDIPVVYLENDHWLVAPPRAGFSRHACRICGHSFRPGDRVVICPCDPATPRCRVAVHRDIVQQLHCWEQWKRGDASQQCLATT